MDDAIEERLAAVERAVTDGDHDLAALATAAETGERLADIEAETESLEDRIAELEAATQALRGYVGNVRAVNEDVEERADLALEKAETALEATQRGDDASTPARTTADSARPPSRVTATDRQDCVCGAVGTTDRTGADSGESCRDPTALANADRERATDGGTTGGQTDDIETTGILARIRAFV